MGRGVLLLFLVVAETCWASSGSGLSQGLNQGQTAEAGVAAPASAVFEIGGYKWPFAYAPSSLYKRLPAQYNFGLGKRASSAKLYSFGLGKRAADYDDDSEDELTLSDDDGLTEADKRARAYEFGLGKRGRSYEFGLGKRARAYEFGLGKRARTYEFGLGKRARAYEFGLGKRARTYEFGLGKRGPNGDRKLYSFGLGKRLPSGERRYAFGIGKRSDADSDEQADGGDEIWQSSAVDTAAVGKREVAPQELKEVAAESSHEDKGPSEQRGSRSKRAAQQYSFGLGKRMSEMDSDLEDEDALPMDDLPADDDLLARPARAGYNKQYGFGLGKRMPLYRLYDTSNSKRGPRQYGFGLGRRSMQYNFGIGKRSPVEVSDANATPSPTER